MGILSAKVAKPAKNVRILTLDIENSPNVAHVWSLFKQNVSLAQLQETAQTISVALKWYGEKEIHFFSDHHTGHVEMIKAVHAMVDEADIIVGYNSAGFDMKHLNREFVLAGLLPPSPYKNVDLLKVVRDQFRFSSGKLDHVAAQLGLGKKTAHSGHELWVRCMADDPQAWALMKKYNCNDVVLTEKLYDRLRPWITSHPHLGQLAGIEHSCPQCGSDKLERVATIHANVTSYRGYRCTNCGSNIRGTGKLQDATRTRAAR
jgi:DNA polymerase elongation subunit (family B)